MPKAKAVKEKVETNGHKPDEFKLIPVDDIFPGLNNPRKVFHEKPLEELTASVKEHGILEPLLVINGPALAARRGCYEIVAGERRYRAAEKAGLRELPCIVKDLTEKQIEDIQFDENAQREGLEPMDEARFLKFYIDNRGWTVDECAARLHKDVRFIAQRLKLNDLILKCQVAMDEGKLPVTHAYIISRYEPKDQKHLADQVYGKDFKSFDGYNATIQYLKQTVANSIEMRLSDAVFDLNSKKLHPEGLSCEACPQRVGSNPTLFEPVTAKEDRCTNRACFKAKTKAHWQNVLDSWTEKGKKRFGEDYQAVAVYTYYKPNDRQFRDALPREQWKDSVIRLLEGGKGAQHCDSSEHALLVSSYEKPREVQICRDRECEHHWNVKETVDITRSHNVSANPENLEECFNCEIAKTVGIRVLLEAAGRLAPDITDKPFLAGLAALGWYAGTDNGGRDVVEAYIRSVVGGLAEYVEDWDLVAPWLERNFTERQFCELLFVLSYSRSLQSNFYRYRSQGGIKALAEKAGIDYRLYDAEARVQQADSQHVKKLQAYLDDVRAGKNTPIPNLWSKKWKRDDSIREYTDADFESFKPDGEDDDEV